MKLNSILLATILLAFSDQSLAAKKSVVYNANNCASTYLSGPNQKLDPKSVYRIVGVHNSSEDQFFQLTCPIDAILPDYSPKSIEVYARYRGHFQAEKHQSATAMVGCYISHRNWNGTLYKFSAFTSFVGDTDYGAKTIGPIQNGFESSGTVLKCTLGPGMTLFNYATIIN